MADQREHAKRAVTHRSISAKLKEGLAAPDFVALVKEEALPPEVCRARWARAIDVVEG